MASDVLVHNVTDEIFLMRILIKTDSHPSKIARLLSTSTLYSSAARDLHL